MKWKNFKIGTKLGIAFGSIIILLLIIGGIYLFNIINIDKKTSSLSDDYLPMSIISNNISLSTQKVVLLQQNFSYTFEKKYIDESRKYLDSLKTYLKEAKDLTEKHSNLDLFKSTIENTDKSIADYESGISLIENKAANLNENKNRAEQLKSDFNNNSIKYLDLQRKLLNYEIFNAKPNWINERLNRILTFNESFNKALEGFNILLGINNIQEINNLSLAVNCFDDVETQLTKIQTVSRGEENKQVANIKDEIIETKILSNKNFENFNEIKKVTENNINLTNQLLDDYSSVARTKY